MTVAGFLTRERTHASQTTAHGGTLVTNGPVRALAIKIPPQGKEDTVFVN
jgi:hypothetical protein